MWIAPRMKFKYLIWKGFDCLARISLVICWEPRRTTDGKAWVKKTTAAPRAGTSAEIAQTTQRMPLMPVENSEMLGISIVMPPRTIGAGV